MIRRIHGFLIRLLTQACINNQCKTLFLYGIGDCLVPIYLRWLCALMVKHQRHGNSMVRNVIRIFKFEGRQYNQRNGSLKFGKIK